MGVLDNLKPKEVFKYFEEICAIPHGSRNLQQISDYLVDFAKKRGLEYRQDEALNVIIKKPASEGCEGAPTVIFQGHMDMVAVKEAACNKDLMTEGLDLEIEGDFITAKGTSLGGDDGIAVAYALALLDDDSLIHPALEVVITTNEEIGMLGATALDTSDLKGEILLNADSEDEGIFTVSCAGGATVITEFSGSRQKTSKEAIALYLHDLTGGHSGAEIHKDRANASYLMGRILMRLEADYDLCLYSIHGGDKDNAITIENKAVFVLENGDSNQGIEKIENLFEDIKEEYADTDPDMKLDVRVINVGDNILGNVDLSDAASTDEMEVYDGNVLDKETTSAVIAHIIHLPQGVVKMSHDMAGLVQTSMNLGIIKTCGNTIQLTYSVRSSKESEKIELIELIKHMASYVGGKSKVEGVYPGWDYKNDNKIERIMVEEYKKIYGEAPRVEGIHAGLECGIMISKMPDLEAISFGPQMYDIHTFKERLSISSTERTWNLLVNTLKAITN
ncbi:MAG: aminoacyl-histidine dipeptidase [Lachnospiraceae bacterium]|nr:aminoacyl-histidine dipeptidase [Lachnospiraceae bacterium]